MQQMRSRKELALASCKLPALVLVGIACFLGLTAPREISADDWPQYRGPNRDGISRETEWGTANWSGGTPKILWRAAIGIGFSSIAVSNGHAYSMGNIEGNTDVLFCLDVETGREVWRYSYPCPLDPKNHEGGPHATPTVDRDLVFILSKMGHLACFEAATGKLRWYKDFRAEFGAQPPEWGYSGSPLVVGNKVIVEVGASNASLVAFDRNTGQIAWKASSDKAAYSSPVYFKLVNYELIASFPASGLLISNAVTGEALSRFAWKTAYDVNAATPIIIDNDKVFISSGYGTGCALIQIGQGPPKVLWRNREMKNHFNSCVFAAGYLYGFDESELKCLAAADGSVRWTQSGLGKGSLLLAGDRLVVLSERGELVVAPASPDGFRPTARGQILSGKCWTMPAFANGLLYARNAAGDLVCVDMRGK